MTINGVILSAYLLTFTTCNAFGIISSTTNIIHASTNLMDGPSPIAPSGPWRRSLCITEMAAEDGSEEAAEAAATEEKKASPAADILSSPSFLKKKLDVLKSDIEAVEVKREAANAAYEAGKAEWGSQIDNLKKEYSNIEDRFKSMSKGEIKTVTIEVARKLLDVLDNFDRAFGQVKPGTDAELAVEASYKDVYGRVLKTFVDLGIEEVKTVGLEFDYEFHQAVMTQPVEDYEEGVVCEELAKGYLMEDGTLIRAAMVVVAA